jgi:hypothetical protein
MKKLVLLLAAVMLLAVGAFADTEYNSFTGTYDPYWHPLGYPDTSTYGETFTAPNSGDHFLQSFTFYLAGPYTAGDIVMGAYIAEWTGDRAGAVLWSSGAIDYPNTGNDALTFNTGGIELTPGASYVAFLSVSEFYGESSGQTYISAGNGGVPGGTFVYFNNGGDFNKLFSQSWDGIGLSPDFAFSATFNSGGGTVPEPGTLLMLGTGLIGAIGVARRKLNR